MYLYIAICEPPRPLPLWLSIAEYRNSRPAMLKHARALGPCPAALARLLVPSLNVRLAAAVVTFSSVNAVLGPASALAVS